MKKIKHLLVLMSCLLLTNGMFAQLPSHEQYIKFFPDGKDFHTGYLNWVPGTPLFPETADDEDFYISRVKPKTRFTSSATQVDPTMKSERNLLWWCPVGVGNDGNWNAFPSYHFDSEVFSMWSYMDIWGNWTAPFIRMPGAFADVAHKNGVRTSVLASVPWAKVLTSTDVPHGTNMKAMIDGGPEKLLKFLRYYGIDGIGYNSEFTISTGLTAEGLKGLLSGAFAKKDELKWPTFTNAWYSLMTNGGSVGGTDALSSSNKDWFHYNGYPTSDAYFMNYNWGASGLETSQTTAKTFPGRSSFDVYAGMDFQGRSSASWTQLKNYDISVGIWGAHNMNMNFETRGELGSTALQKQKTYQLINENVFTGSSYNPVNTPEISNLLAHTSRQTNFHGFSSFITARSTLTTSDLSKEPFVTYFNLGNGMFFNVKGKKEYPGEWYNIGMQDYLPTWRWWWSTQFMGREAADVPTNGLKAEFTWDDAWFGGSCLSISGATTSEYLHLFKTEYPLSAGDVITIRYKVVSGTAGNMYWASSAKGTESTLVSTRISPTTGLVADNEVWIEKTFKVGATAANFRMAGKTLAMLGLRFENTSSDFKILIGEISLTRGTAPTPVAPSIKSSKMLNTNFKGADFKLSYKMADPVAPETPIYNSDVNTWYFKIYMQQEGGEQTFCTSTTSWAAYVVAAPLDVNGTKRVRVGVSAVSLDGKSESTISWTDYQDLPASKVVEGIEIDKPIIKPNETFTIKFVDPTHPAGSWKILNAQTDEVVGQSSADGTSFTTSLPLLGIYDLKLTSGGVETLYQGLIQISSTEVGAVPEILSLKANDSETAIEVNPDVDVTYSYVGKPADGVVSRGLQLSEKAFGIPADQLGFDGTSKYSLSFWFTPSRFNHGQDGTQLVNIRTASDPWPSSDWGYIWSSIGPDGKFSISFRKTTNEGTQIDVDNFVFKPNQWYHMALVVDYQGGRLMTLYVNGRKIKTSELITNLYSWKTSNIIMIGGKAFNRAGLEGFLDEFQLYNKALTQEEVLNSMQHQTTIPEGLIGYWDFETDPGEDGYIMSTGSNPALKAGTVDAVQIKEGVNQYNPVQSTFGTGAPFISGQNFKVVTTPTWSLGKGASIVTPDASGTDKAGSITAKYASEGVYSATLKLANGWGEDTKTFNYVTVKVYTSVDDVRDIEYSVYPNPFVDELYVRFENAGSYDVAVTNLAGQLVSQRKLDVSADQFVNIGINGASGNYLVSVYQSGKLLKSVKVVKK
ncbi:MAG: T9SS type A sorting domain-containing protein [Bacteroidia bacterium]|nr:T9SS type A sorting domain-containing protein [Bacteroidia bacterium]